MGFFSDFKKFAMRGNVMDMAVGIIIGGAFSAIVTSLVNDVIMPPIGILLGGVDFSSLAFTLKQASGDDAAVVLSYGKFINTIVNFLIIAFSVFLMIRAINRLETKKEEEPKAEPVPTEDQKLLTEIRDLLKETGQK